MKNEHDWIDEFYTELERGLTKYKRPENWRERMLKTIDKQFKPVRNQKEGRARRFNDE